VQYGLDQLGKKMKILYSSDGLIDLTSIEDVNKAKELTKNRKLDF
jgi:hypothetical protein